jgi:hypothetical protein
MIINILAITLIISLLCMFIYVFAVPWFKGTMVKSDNINCKVPGKCPEKSWCCKDPRKGKLARGYCVTKKCSDIRLENPSDKKLKFFNIYIVCITVLLVVLALLKQRNVLT